MAEITLQKLRQRFHNTAPMTNSSTESGMRSLELVRIAVQSSFDKEVDELVKQYIEVWPLLSYCEHGEDMYIFFICRPILSRPSTISKRIWVKVSSMKML